MKKYTIVVLMIFFIFVYLIACVNVRTARKNPALQDLQIKQATETNHYAGFKGQAERNEDRLYRRGKKIFRFDTFHDEQFWTDQLHFQKAIAGKKGYS